MLGVWGLAVLACVLGLATPPGRTTAWRGARSTSCTSAAPRRLRSRSSSAPGIVLRARPRPRHLELGFLPLPGLACLRPACVAWVLAGDVAAWLVCLLILAPVLAWMPVRILRANPGGCWSARSDSRCWSSGASSGSRSPEPSGRSARWGALRRNGLAHAGGRRSLRQPHPIRHRQLVAHGAGPFSALAASYFSPFDFSSRGPLAGLASAPIVFAAGGRPPAELPNQPWTPFDPQGFMAFRIAAMAFASTAFLSLWTLIRTPRRPPRRALRPAAGGDDAVPGARDLVHVAEAVRRVIRDPRGDAPDQRHPLHAGLLGGAAYLVHPGALLYVPVLVVMALWPLAGLAAAAAAADRRVRGRRRRDLARRLARDQRLALHAERVPRLPHTGGLGRTADVHNWISARLESLRNTLGPADTLLLTDDLDTGVVRGALPA